MNGSQTMSRSLSDILKDKSLFRQQCLIDGEWVESDNGERITIYNPATELEIGTVPNCGNAETARAIEAAHKAFSEWSNHTARERGAILLEWERLALENIDDLAAILTYEEGKPLSEARGEILQGLSYLPWYAAEASRVTGQVIPPYRHHIQALTRQAPLGVAAAITPWNFPFSMLPRKLAPALASGCTTVVKPSAKTPFSALAFCELGVRAGLPAGTINVICGDSERIGAEITRNPVVRKLSFTGSTRVGKILAKQCASTLKRVSLELGGNAPFLVFEDADMEKAVNLAMTCKFRNAGQTCICANRFLVEESICEDFAKAMEDRASEIHPGNGMNPHTDMGPLITPEACVRVDGLVKNAITEGAKLLTGGNRAMLGPYFYEPTVLIGVKPKMHIFKEEIFGPVVSITPFRNEDEAISLANRSHYGLAAYACTKSMRRIWKLYSTLQYGMLGINDTTLASPDVPFGGIKESGQGREGSIEGILEYMETRYLLLGGLEN